MHSLFDKSINVLMHTLHNNMWYIHCCAIEAKDKNNPRDRSKILRTLVDRPAVRQRRNVRPLTWRVLKWQLSDNTAPAVVRQFGNMAGLIGTIGPFTVDESWEAYVERLVFYFQVNDIAADKRLPAFLSIIGSQTYCKGDTPFGLRALGWPSSRCIILCVYVVSRSPQSENTPDSIMKS